MRPSRLLGGHAQTRTPCERSKGASLEDPWGRRIRMFYGLGRAVLCNTGTSCVYHPAGDC